jgi:hypothetical protein
LKGVLLGSDLVRLLGCINHKEIIMIIVKDNAPSIRYIGKSGDVESFQVNIRDTTEIFDDEWDVIYKGYSRMKMSSEGIMEWQSFSQYIHELIKLSLHDRIQ